MNTNTTDGTQYTNWKTVKPRSYIMFMDEFVEKPTDRQSTLDEFYRSVSVATSTNLLNERMIELSEELELFNESAKRIQNIVEEINDNVLAIISFGALNV